MIFFILDFIIEIISYFFALPMVINGLKSISFAFFQMKNRDGFVST